MNPFLKNFMDDNPKLTVLGLFWAGLWRFYAILILVGFVMSVAANLLN
jgi:hypothetical protein